MEIKEEQIPINDGSGIYDRNGMIDGLIVDCENVMKSIMAGEGIQLAAILVEMVQKLSTLKKGTAEETARLTKERDDAREYSTELAKGMMHFQKRAEEAEKALEAERQKAGALTAATSAADAASCSQTAASAATDPGGASDAGFWEDV